MKLPDDVVEGCWNDVKVARKDFKDKMAPTMERNLEFYYSNQWDQSQRETGLRHVVVNYSASNLLIKYDALTFRAPEFSVKPTEKTDPITPYKLSAYLKQKFVDCGARNATQAALLDCLIFGTGCVMNGWSAGWLRPVPIYDPEEEKRRRDQERQMAEGLAFFGPMGASSVVPRISSELVEVVGDGPKVVHVPIESVVMDPRSKWHDYKDARYQGRIYVRGVDEIKRNRSLDNLDKIKGTASFKNTDNEWTQDPGIRNLPENPSKQSVLLADVWWRQLKVKNGFTDTRGRRYAAGEYPIRIVWDTANPEYPLLIELWPYEFPDNLGMWQYPFDFIHNRPDPKAFWGISEMTIQEPQQMELNRSRSQEMTRAEQLGNVKFWAKRGNVPATQKARLESTQNGILIEGNVDQPPVQIQKAGLDGEIAQNSLHAVQDMTVMTGVDDAARGVNSQQRMTATEVQVTAEKSAPRGAKMQDKWEVFLAEAAEKVVQTCINMDHTGDPVTVNLPKELAAQAQSDPYADPSARPAEQPGEGSQIMEIEEDDLVPSQVSVVAGSTRQLDKQTQLAGIQQVVATAVPLGMMASAQNPQGVNSRYILERIVELTEAGDPERMFDVSAYQQEYEQAQAAQAQAVMAASSGAQAAEEVPMDDQGLNPQENVGPGAIQRLLGGGG